MRITFAAWLTALSGFVMYLQAAGQSRHTIKLRTYWVRRLARETGSQDPWTLSAERIIEWLAEPSWSPETRKAARASVCSFYRWAIEAGELPPDDSPADRLPAVNVPRSVPRPAPSPVLSRALLQATDRDRLLLMLAAYAGLRRAEVARVHPDDVDRERMVLVVRGKGGRVREIPVHPDLLAAIDAELDRRRAGGHGSGWRYTTGIDPDAYLFPGTKGPHLTAGHVGKVLCRLLGGRWTAHTLRHRFATRAHEETRDLRAVQELLGHSKLETTQRYVAVSSDTMRAAVLAAASVA